LEVEEAVSMPASTGCNNLFLPFVRWAEPLKIIGFRIDPITKDG
jgi:hypothetical protein